VGDPREAKIEGKKAFRKVQKKSFWISRIRNFRKREGEADRKAPKT